MSVKKNLRVSFLLTLMILIIGGTSACAMNKPATNNQESQETPSYPINESGQTYGSPADAFSVETLPDLIHVGSMGMTDESRDMTELYIYAKDLISSMPKTQEEAQAIVDNPIFLTMYEEDGKTIIKGGSMGFCPELLPESIRNEYATPTYPVNEDGKTYGSSTYATWIGVEPDLIRAIGPDGTVGYVYNSDLYESIPNTPEEALARQAERGSESRSIPLYKEDGKTIIGEFVIGP